VSPGGWKTLVSSNSAKEKMQPSMSSKPDKICQGFHHDDEIGAVGGAIACPYQQRLLKWNRDHARYSSQDFPDDPNAQAFAHASYLLSAHRRQQDDALASEIARMATKCNQFRDTKNMFQEACLQDPRTPSRLPTAQLTAHEAAGDDYLLPVVKATPSPERSSRKPMPCRRSTVPLAADVPAERNARPIEDLKAEAVFPESSAALFHQQTTGVDVNILKVEEPLRGIGIPSLASDVPAALPWKAVEGCHDSRMLKEWVLCQEAEKQKKGWSWRKKSQLVDNIWI
jgi:hypothetical protein